MAEKILVIEDEPALQDTLVYNLEHQGYEVDSASDGQNGLDKAKKNLPDLVVLDIMLPVIDGFEVCRILRNTMNMPILILTARDEEIDRIIGLEIGADDYLTKPFSMREFLARVKALLRRVRLDQVDIDIETAVHDILKFSNLEIDILRREVRLNNIPLSLKPKEYDLLLFLARHKGQVLTRNLILDKVWGWDFSGGSRTVDVHVSWLREKIEESSTEPKRIVTVRGAGYRFEG